MTTLTKALSLIGIAAVLALTGCSVAAPSNPGASAPGVVPEAPTETAPVGTAVVITGTISIVTDDPLVAAEQASGFVRAAGGRIDGRTESSANRLQGASAHLVMRIPAAKVDEVRGKLATLGQVDHTQLDAVEVGAAQRDLDARIATLRISLERYTGWLEGATAIADLIKLEQEIAERQGRLEALESEQRALADQVAMSHIELTLRSTMTAADPEPASFLEALVRGWHGFVGFWSDVLISLGYGLPWLVLLAALTILVIWLVRRAGKRSAAQRQTQPVHPGHTIPPQAAQQVPGQ